MNKKVETSQKKQQYLRIANLGLLLDLAMVYSNWKKVRLNIATFPSKLGNANNT